MELHRVKLGVGRHKSLAVVVELVRIVDLEEGHHTAVVGNGFEEVALRKVAVEMTGALAAVGLGYEEHVHMAAAEVEGILVVAGKDCAKELRMVFVGVVGSPGCTGPAVHTHYVAAAVTEAADQV